MEDDKKSIPDDNSPADGGESGLGRLSRLIASAVENDEDQPAGPKPFIPPPDRPKLRILKYLRPLPWILCILFAFSFFWDFQGYSFSLFQCTFPLEGFIIIISVSVFIVYLTNWIAITMLFRPLKKRP
ncbi:MAG: hypothetical protein R3283_04390, partial [Balneolaceae bacterium]|nr:hypothetical protein [Balneolaceae bacterium]